MNDSWIRIVKAVIDHPIFWIGASPMQLWIYLLCAANYKAKLFHGRIIKRGQLLTSYRSLMTISGWSQHTIESYLKLLIKEDMIHVDSQNNKHGGTLITVINYYKYQDVINGTVVNFDTPSATDTATDTATDSTSSVAHTVALGATNITNNIYPPTPLYTREEILETEEKLKILARYCEDEDMISVLSNLCRVEKSFVSSCIIDLGNEIKTGDKDDSRSEADLLTHLKNYIRTVKRINEAKGNGSNKQKNDKRRGAEVSAKSAADYGTSF